MKHLYSFLSGVVAPIIVLILSSILSVSSGWGFVLLFITPILYVAAFFILIILKLVHKEKYNLPLAMLALVLPASIQYFLALYGGI